MTTGPRTGLSSVACETPAGVITSMALGTVDGSTEQIGAVPARGADPERVGARRGGEGPGLVGAEPVLAGQHHR